MSVKYNVVERGKPGDLLAPKKYYPSVTASGRRTLRQMANRISQISTMSSTDVMAAIESFLTVIPEELANGNIVELGDFGTFWLKNNSDGEEIPEAVSAKNITNLLPRFTPGKEFKKVMKTVEFEKTSTPSIGGSS
ncbi:MAG: HU family DNA-binding protein [Anaerolineales bacterium]|nr:HU family DNA-binding protein [Anaerolineales bacterium]